MSLRFGNARFVVFAIFQIQAHGAGFDELQRNLMHLNGSGRVAGFHIRGDRNIDGAGDVADGAQHFVGTDLLAVSITQRVCDARASRSYGGESKAFEDASAGYVPGICEQKNFRAIVEGTKFFGFFSLRDAHCGSPMAEPVCRRRTVLG